MKQQGEVLTITLASEEDLEPVQDSIQFTEQEWKGEWIGQCIKVIQSKSKLLTQSVKIAQDWQFPEQQSNVGKACQIKGSLLK